MARAWITAGIIGALLALGMIGVATAGESTGDNPFDDDHENGLHIGAVLQRDLDSYEPDLMRAAGIDSVRFWLRWHVIEHTRGVYDWHGSDEEIRELANAGLTPLPFLFGTPPWAAQVDGFECLGTDCAPYAPSSPETREAFASFAAAAVQRYGPNGTFWADNPTVTYQPIHDWQLWNEPNLHEFWRPWVDPLGYAELVKLASARIKDEDPNAEVLLAGVSGGRTTFSRWSPAVFLNRFYDVPGIGLSFNGVTSHPYAARMRGVRDRIDAVRSVLEARDPNADLWVTEIGWASAGNKSTLVKSERRQAKLLLRAFTRLIAHADEWDLRGIYWYAWRDTERGHSVCGWCAKAGLRDRDGLAKPAYRELSRLTR